MEKKRKILLYVLAIIALLFVLHALTGDFSQIISDQTSTIETIIKNSGPLTYVLYVGLIVFMVMSPLPSSSVWLIGGYLFPIFIALPLTLLAEALGSVCNYYVGIYTIGALIKNGKLPHLRTVVEKLEPSITPRNVFLMGLLPISSTNVTAYAAALARMPLRQFVIAWMSGVTLLGTLTVFLGHSAAHFHPLFTILIIVGVVLTVSVLKRIAGTFIRS